MLPHRHFFRWLLVRRLEDTNVDVRQAFLLLLISLPDLQVQRDTIEDMRPLRIASTLLQLDETVDDFTLDAVDVLLVQQLPHSLPHGVTAAGGAGALVGRFRFGPGWSGYLV